LLKDENQRQKPIIDKLESEVGELRKIVPLSPFVHIPNQTVKSKKIKFLSALDLVPVEWVINLIDDKDVIFNPIAQ
jgi:hypothetical protein